MKSRDAARAALGLPPDQRWILWAGAMTDVKRPADAILAFSALRRRHGNVRLAMAGEGQLRRAVEDMVNALGLSGDVVLLGHLNREVLTLWHHSADVFCNSSRSEGTPTAVLEAVVAGTPVAAYRTGGIPAVVEVLEAGTITARPNPVELAAAIETELGVARSKPKLAQRARVFDLERAVNPIRRTYRDLANE
jgi:glycosyltransferase involved in cell wall biosynthesis